MSITEGQMRDAQFHGCSVGHNCCFFVILNDPATNTDVALKLTWGDYIHTDVVEMKPGVPLNFVVPMTSIDGLEHKFDLLEAAGWTVSPTQSPSEKTKKLDKVAFSSPWKTDGCIVWVLSERDGFRNTETDTSFWQKDPVTGLIRFHPDYIRAHAAARISPTEGHVSLETSQTGEPSAESFRYRDIWQRVLYPDTTE